MRHSFTHCIYIELALDHAKGNQVFSSPSHTNAVAASICRRIMVKWAEQITKTSAVNAHLFKPSDYVRYAEIVAPLEENRDNHSARINGTGIALDQKSIFGRGLRMIDEEMVKIESIVVETIRALQQSIRGT